MSKHILVVDDEVGIRESLKLILEKEGYAVSTASNADEAFKQVRQGDIDLLITDIRMAGMDGVELLKLSKSISPYTEVIMITGYASVDSAVESMKEGAYDYITKPFKKADILRAVSKAVEKQTLALDNQSLKKQVETLETNLIVGVESPQMKEVLSLVNQVAPSQATILILGGTGTGKEVIANMIHKLSPRADRPMIKVNCAAIPETLIEAELFGYERGAFTGAESRREGRFEAADKSTIFLDEIGEVPAAVQVKLLRVLQEGTIERLGSNKSVHVDARIIAATNKHLVDMVKEGAFREDLYWRLNVITINLPGLKERKEDIPALVTHFLSRYAMKNGKNISGIETKALHILLTYDWPGNVRELENVIERCVVLDRDGIIGEDDLPKVIAEGVAAAHTRELLTFQVGTPLEEVERLLMEQTLKYTKGDKAMASKLLGISTRTLYRKIDRKEDEE
ncbi:MAG: sigma-54 dependent transcriptional regulator [Syntrophaceae bacterium]